MKVIDLLVGAITKPAVVKGDEAQRSLDKLADAEVLKDHSSTNANHANNAAIANSPAPCALCHYPRRQRRGPQRKTTTLDRAVYEPLRLIFFGCGNPALGASMKAKRRFACSSRHANLLKH